ncbi:MULTISPECIES: GNAT family N-acetyltransferase [unclassified Aerococcus]|uniref:GNAT family N-acetyltransferase n=1 Tax=unclassified Aerococcus TaxID=2618060 RepID=UPI0025C5E49C|nr:MULTISPECIES: GNAT family N-acetyltransferase [unclassified Aerococcus]
MEIKKVNYIENKNITKTALDKYTKEMFPELDNESKELSFLYEENGKILGRIVGFLHWDHIQIELFFVSKDSRGKGVGISLFSKIEELARQNKVSYILLETMSFNAPTFYEKRGFELLATIENSPVKNENRYFYIKRYSYES